MINPSTPGEFGPGLTRQAYLDQLADTGHTGWHDEHGVPAPWPEDFCGVPPAFRTADQIGSDPERTRGIGRKIHEIQARVS